MTRGRTLPWILFPLPEKRHRAFSFKAAVENGFEPSEYRSLLHDEKAMTAEALLDFKRWGKAANLTCYFRNIRSGEKFRLSAFDNKHDRRYTPRDGDIDFSEPGIENGLYLVTTAMGKRKGSRRRLPPRALDKDCGFYRGVRRSPSPHQHKS